MEKFLDGVAWAILCIVGIIAVCAVFLIGYAFPIVVFVGLAVGIPCAIGWALNRVT